VYCDTKSVSIAPFFKKRGKGEGETRRGEKLKTISKRGMYQANLISLAPTERNGKSFLLKTESFDQ
jgi:hypothetical protein